MLISTLACALWAQDPFQVKVTGHGRPMILIPGLSSSGETWDTTVARYQDRFQCHVFTLAGFAGVPRTPAPMMEHAREALAGYIRTHGLDHPAIVGHSLGGFVALDLAAHYPDLMGPLVIVDSYPFMAGIADPKTTPEKARAIAAQMRGYMSSQTQEMYEGYVRSGMGTRTMVEKESDFQRIVAWGLASDRTAVTDWMVELFSADLRGEIASIHSPTLVMGSYIGFPSATHEGVAANLRAQYANLKGVEIQVTDKAHHFIMWDDPEWMFGHLDRFLGVPAPATKR